MENDKRYVNFRSAVEQIHGGESFDTRELSKIFHSVVDLIYEERKDCRKDLINLNKFMDLACCVKTLNALLNENPENYYCTPRESEKVVEDYMKNPAGIFQKYST
jgi:hypothetical protein|tara:strand:- start:1158 stop:1472 length:315 start_codon:yes stop_codon:yes gene_type:complete